MKEKAKTIVGLRGSGLTAQCLTWLDELINQGVKPDRIMVLVRHSVKATEFRRRFTQDIILGEVQVYGFTAFLQAQLSKFWAEVCSLEPGLPDTFQPLFLTKDLTQFLLACAFDRCGDHFQKFRVSSLPEYKILDQIISDSYVAHSACIPTMEIGKRLATAWVDQNNNSYKQMLNSIPCCLQNLRKLALEHKVIDFSFQFDLFHRLVLNIDRFWQSWDYLIVDNAEESNGVFLNFYERALTKGKKLFFAYTVGGGSTYTSGGDGISEFLRDKTTYQYIDLFPGMGKLGIAITEVLEAKLRFPIKLKVREDYTDRVHLLRENTYLEAIETTIKTVNQLLNNNVPPDRIAILMPRFDQALMQVILHSDIADRCSFLNPYMSFLRYPVIHAMITAAQLIETDLVSAPSDRQISDMISILLGIDRIRSILLVNAFDRYRLILRFSLSTRIDQASKDKFDLFIQRLNFYRNSDHRLDYFWRNLIKEFSPNFRLTPTDRDILKSLMSTVDRFFQAFPRFTNFQFIQMLLSGQTPTILRQWEDDPKIMVATPMQFLKTDRVTDYQFWFNISGREWRKPVCRELFNREVLTPSWQPQVYTAGQEQELRTKQLARTLLNLCCRNQKAIYLIKTQTTIQGQDNYSNLDEQILQASRLK